MIEIEKFLNLPCIKSNVTIISVEHGFQVSTHAAPGNTKERKCYKTFHSFKLSSLGLLNLVKNVHRSDFKTSK